MKEIDSLESGEELLSLQVKGMQELIDYFDRQAKIKVSKNALKQAGVFVQEEEVRVAEERHRKYARPMGSKHIKKFPIRNYHGSAFIDIGIKLKKGSGDVDEWSAIRGLYFNHYGFWHNRTGNYIVGSGWMDTAFDNSKEGAYEILERAMWGEINK